MIKMLTINLVKPVSISWVPLAVSLKLILNISFDQQGNPLKLNDAYKLAMELSRVHPVIRLRDARRIPMPKHREQQLESPINDKTENVLITLIVDYLRCPAM